jgi:hypothetical protein
VRIKNVETKNHRANHVLLKIKIPIVIHVGVSCDDCGVSPIEGIRYKCQVCDNYDLCEKCEAKNQHPPTHILLKAKQPLNRPHSHSHPHRHHSHHRGPHSNNDINSACPFLRRKAQEASSTTPNENKSNNNNCDDNKGESCGDKEKKCGRFRRCHFAQQQQTTPPPQQQQQEQPTPQPQPQSTTPIVPQPVTVTVTPVKPVEVKKEEQQVEVKKEEPPKSVDVETKKDDVKPVVTEVKKDEYSGPFATELSQIRLMGFSQPSELIIGLLSAAITERRGRISPVDWVVHKLIENRY